MITDYLKMIIPTFWYRKNQSDTSLQGNIMCVMHREGLHSKPFDTGLKCFKHEFEIIRDRHKPRIASELSGLQFILYNDLGRVPTFDEIKDEFLNRKNAKPPKPEKVTPVVAKTVGNVFEAFLLTMPTHKHNTRTYYIGGLNRIKAAFPELLAMHANALKPTIAEQLHAKLLEKCTQNTAYVSINILKTALNHAVKIELIERNGIASFSPKMPDNEIITISQSDIEAIEAQPISPVRDLLLFLLETGLSHIDTFNFTAKIETIDGRKYLHGQRQKTKGDFFNILSDKALAILERYGDRPPQIVYWKFNHGLKSLCREAGIKKINAHKARHTLAKRIVDATGDLSIVANMLGDNINTVSKFYGKMTVKGFAEKLKKSGL